LLLVHLINFFSLLFAISDLSWMLLVASRAACELEFQLYNMSYIMSPLIRFLSMGNFCWSELLVSF
jgi:hypothetical protein